MEHAALTLITPIAAGRELELLAVLRVIGKRVVDNDLVPFGTLDGVHFARWVVLAPAEGDQTHLLAYESNVDGSAENHLEDLVTRVPEGIDAVYQHCLGYPGPEARTSATRREFLASCKRPYAAFHIGHPGLSVRTILNDVELRRRIGTFVDREQRAGRLDGKSASDIRDRIRDFVRAEADDLDTSPRDRMLPRRSATIALGVVLAILLVALVWVWMMPLRVASVVSAALVVAAGFALGATLKHHEDTDAAEHRKAAHVHGLRDDDAGRDIRDREDRFVQNPLTHLVVIRPGPFRAVVLRAVLWLVELLARRWYFLGKLGELSTIHFGRWVVLEDDRLLFFSNYDGSWESYLGDFIDKEASWLTAVWSSTDGFPPTHWLFTQGAAQEDDFKRWTRDHQIPTQVWFAAYPRCSVINVLDNARLREDLWKDLAEAEVADWLRLL